MNWRAFGARLAREELVGWAPLAARSRQGVPGLVTLLSGFGAWLGAAFLLAALSALSLEWLESASGRVAAGVTICAVCAWRARLRPPGPFMAQFLTAVGVAGTLLAGSVALDAPFAMHLLPLAVTSAAAAMLAANPEPVSRLLMAFLMVAGLAVAALQWSLVPLACVALAVVGSLLWLTQGSWSARRWGALLEPIAAACTAALVLLPAFLGGGEQGLSSLVFEEAPAGIVRKLTDWQGRWLGPTGLAMVLAASYLLIRRKHRRATGTVQGLEPLDAAALLAAGLLAIACWRAPGILACLLAWMLGVAAARSVVAWLGLSGIVLYLFQLYYNLDTSLAAKGVTLAAAGLLLLVMQYLLGRLPLPALDPNADTPLPGSAYPSRHDESMVARSREWADAEALHGTARRGARLPKWLAVAGALVVFAAFNGSVAQKERLLRHGQVLRLALAPVDPRAFMTGDYMALDYRVAGQLNAQMAAGGDSRARDAFAVVAPDSRGVAQLVRLQARSHPLQADEVALKARVRKGRVRLGTDAYYFREGTARSYEKARYGEFRVGADGEMLLVRLLDESLAALPAH